MTLEKKGKGAAKKVVCSAAVRITKECEFQLALMREVNTRIGVKSSSWQLLINHCVKQLINSMYTGSI